jgi:hypothetical protein
MPPVRSLLARSASLLAAGGAVLLGGCLQAKDETKLDAKGGGTLVQVYEVEQATATQLMGIFRAMSTGSLEPPPPGTPDVFPDLLSKETTLALAKDVPGFAVRSHADAVASGKRTVRVEAEFESLEAAAKAGRFLTASVDLAKKEDGSWLLTFQQAGFASFAEALRPGPGGKPAIPGLPEGTDLSAVAGMLEPFLAGLSSRRTLVLPGEVVETNGVRGEDGKSVTWSAGYAEVMGKGVVQRVAFRGEGLALKPFSARVDLDALLRKIRESSRAPKEGPRPPGEAPKGETPAPPAPPPAPTPTPPAME